MIYLDANNIYGCVMPKFLPTRRFKWIHSKRFNLNKHSINSSKCSISEVDLEYPKELRELHNDYLLASDKIKIKIFFLPKYQLKIANFYNIR